MSFFGFNPESNPESRGKEDEAIDFEDIYEDEDDNMNAETFGDDVYVGKDFNFGNQAPSSQPSAHPPSQAVSYAEVASHPTVDDLMQPMASLWNNPVQPPQENLDSRVLSLEEIESQLMGNPFQFAGAMPQIPPHMAQVPPGFPGYGFPQMPQFQQFPQGIPQNHSQGLPQNHSQGQFPQGQFPQGQFAQTPFPQGQPQPPPGFPFMMQPPVMQHDAAKSPPDNSSTAEIAAEASSPAESIPTLKADMSQFPVLGSKEAESASRASPQVHKGPRNHRPSFHDSDLPDEERNRLARRSNKVSRITRFSGFMTPRDKDFVTRFQLSQIVTEDPYNEDFYYQVHKVLNVQGDNLGGMSSIAEKYLEHSGHRLGGRNKRADVALQRMQQQVSKAVSVAKERGAKNATLAKEGALGKVSIGSGKTPKRQLNIKTKEDKEATPEVAEGGIIRGLKDKSSSQPPALDKNVSKTSKLFFLLLIEQIYEIVLKLESSEREKQLTEESVGELWSLLGFSENPDDTHGQDFVNTLSYDKGMKIFPRLFHFLSYEQKLIIITVIMRNLQKIDIILKSSHRNNFGSDTGMPTTVLRKMEVFQITVLKTLVFFLSDAKFVEVLKLLIIIINENNLLFLCSTKLGLSIITILISRLEVIKQENQTKLSAQDLSAWAATYDKLFQSLEGRFKSIFHQPLEDDSYIWQFFASLSLAGKLSHQRVIVDEIRDEIFGVMGKARLASEQGDQELPPKLIGNLNLFLNVMGLNATETDITELKA